MDTREAATWKRPRETAPCYLSVVCLLSVLRVYCDKTTNDRIRGFHQNVAKCLIFCREGSVKAKFDRCPLIVLELRHGGMVVFDFLLMAIISETGRVQAELLYFSDSFIMWYPCLLYTSDAADE